MICERHWVSFVQYRLSPLACYSLADGADYAEGMQQAALFRRERQVVLVVFFGGVLFCCFGALLLWGLSASSARSAGDIGVSICAD